MEFRNYTRRQFLRVGAGAALVLVPVSRKGIALAQAEEPAKPVVSITKIRDGDIPTAVGDAIDLLGGIQHVTAGKQRILLKPNLVVDSASCTTKPEVIGALARLMLNAGKEVVIGEGSAGATGFNMSDVHIANPYVTRCPDLLEGLQECVFERLGYTTLARALGVPLVNLHLGDLVNVRVPQGLFWKEISLPRILTEIDLLCSVPMMKTHAMATVTLGLKNLIGCYAGCCYGTLRYWVHDLGVGRSSPGAAFEILDMAQVNKLGLTVIDASTAMEGLGPTDGTLVPMNLIIAATNPLAADMVAARVMNFTNLEAIPQFAWAHKLGMRPASLDDQELCVGSIHNIVFTAWCQSGPIRHLFCSRVTTLLLVRHPQWLGDPSHRQGRLPPQSRRQRQLHRIALAPLPQDGIRPCLPSHSLPTMRRGRLTRPITKSISSKRGSSCVSQARLAKCSRSP